MTAQEAAERRTASLNYYSPVWYTLSGLCRVSQRGDRFRAEIRVSRVDFAVIGDGAGTTLREALRLAVTSDRYA